MGLFGPCVSKLIPGRSKFDPTLHPDHAPKVPIERGEEYFELVKQRCPVRSGALLASLKLEDDGETWAWVSSDTLYGGMVLEWGSCKMPRSLILSSSARRFMQDSRSPEAKAQDKRISSQLAKDSLRRLREGLREDLAFGVNGPHAKDSETVQTVTGRLRAILKERFARPPGDELPLHMLQALRKVKTFPQTLAGKRLEAKLRGAETLRDLSGLVRYLTGRKPRKAS